MQATEPEFAPDQTPFLDRPVLGRIVITWETILVIAILGIAIFTRFFLLEPRVMSHDETSHVYFSWLLSQGRGYLHDPVTHGPFQFHAIALSYFMFGDNDFTARIPVVLFSIATVGFIWYFRRYLGRAGTIIAMVLFTISPFMLYYGRYVRNESFVALYGVVTLWSILRYFETGRPRYLYYLTAATVMHFITKETSYIYHAQVLLFLALYLVYRIITNPWEKPGDRRPFLYSLMAALALAAAAVLVRMLVQPTAVAENGVVEAGGASQTIPMLFLVLAAAAMLPAVYFVLRGYTLPRLRQERVFDLLMLQGALALPLLSAFPLYLLEKPLGLTIPVNATQMNELTFTHMLLMGGVLLVMFTLSFVAGLWWNKTLYLGNMALFYAVTIVFYTTVFTNGAGFFTGIIGGLGYWLAQQEVQRGSQPWYYYLLIQVPVYEFLPALGSLLALALALAGKRLGVFGWFSRSEAAVEKAEPEAPAHPVQVYSLPDEDRFSIQQPPILALLGFWVVSSFFAYSYAGEKMPWLTVHITLPMLLLAGLSLGYLVESMDWKSFRDRWGLVIVALLPVFIASLAVALGSLLGSSPPFQGRELAQLSATGTFMMSALGAAASGAALVYLLKDWSGSAIWRLILLASFAMLGVLTTRAAFMASYINYDNASEYLVYAHSGPGNKVALRQIEELSRRTTDGLAIAVAYDDVSSYPFWWYLRNFSQQRYYGDTPSRDLRQVPVILAADRNYSKIEPVVGQAYHSFEYIRIWWPDQDYYYLTWDRIRNAITDPQMRTAIFRIWLNRDYSLYSQLVGKDMSLPNWEPSEEMRLYVRKDIAAQLWEYGTSAEEVVADPYEAATVTRSADRVIGEVGSVPGQFFEPRNMAIAPDGSLYVADSGNNRIQHLSQDGTVLHVWGSYTGDGVSNPAPGTFSQPWGIAVGPDGSVYVSDTWNHRVQKFTPEGDFITQWGILGQADSPFSLWGPRGIAVDAEGKVLVSDTGNKRILLYDEDGGFISQFGTSGFGMGQFNEPVSVAVGPDGSLYVTDTWNQRVQMFSPNSSGSYTPVLEWEIFGWYGQSLENKPFVAVSPQGNVFVTDPEANRVLEFDAAGQFVRTWGDLGATPDRFRLPTGIAVDPDGGVWVVDTGNGRIMRFGNP